jgi:ParB family chromosome partitioning protein
MSITTIPLTKLTPSALNVRKTGGQSVDDLAASIAAHGLKQNLVVIPASNGRYGVLAGGRRLAALRRLAKAGTIAKDFPVPCLIDETSSATEVSLAENTIRQAMHPADQFEAFKALADDQHLSPADIAARFGCSEELVHQRLKLGRVSAKLIAAYRRDEINLETLMAFTLTDDPARQEALFKALKKSGGLHANAVRRHLTETKIGTDHRAVKFVGLEAYEAAGGTLTRDLFAERGEGYLDNPALVARLATEKLEAEAATLRAAGWKWVEVMLEIPYLGYGEYRQHHGPITKEVQAATGAIVGIGYDGTLRVETAVLRKGDRLPGSKGDAARPAEKPALSAAVVADLSAHRTQAMRAMLASDAEVALIALVHALAVKHFFPYAAHQAGCLQLSLDVQPLAPAMGMLAERDTKAHAALERREAAWRERLPECHTALWEWLLQASTPVRLELLAFLIAPAVNAVQPRQRAAVPHSHVLAQALGLDMADWWQPSAKGFFQRVPKAKVCEALTEAGITPVAGQPAFATMKKSALCACAEAALADTRWLPEPLRAVDPASLAAEAFDYPADEEEMPEEMEPAEAA